MALTEALMLSSSAVPAAKFSDVYAELLQVNPGKRKRNLDASFEVGTLLFRIYISFLQQCSIRKVVFVSVAPPLSI